MVKINQKEFDVIMCYYHDKKQIEHYMLKGTDHKYIVEENFAETLREWSIDFQLKSGYNEFYELNSVGKILETIIDKTFL